MKENIYNLIIDYPISLPLSKEKCRAIDRLNQLVTVFRNINKIQINKD